VVIARRALARLRGERERAFLERVRFGAFVLGCASLFWQWDLAAADVFFILGIAASLAMWERGAPLLDLAWPQPLLLLFLSISAVVTTLEAGSVRFFEITAYLAVVACALASALRRDPRRVVVIEAAIVIAGAVTAITVTAGAAAKQLGVPFLQLFAYDYLRGEGLFKDPNVAGAFVACAYPLAAARSLRLGRGRIIFLVVATVVFAAGVIYSYSRWALILLALGVAATIVVLAIARDRGPLIVLAAMAAVVAIVGQHTLPSYRYQAVQSYDENGRLLAWRLALQLTVERPLGIGAGSFEEIAVERFSLRDGTADSSSRPKEKAGTTSNDSPNLVANGAFEGAVGWHLPGFATAIDDPSSPTGHALRKVTTDVYQDPGISIPVEEGLTYSFGAAIRTDGTPALLVVHWRDSNDVTLGQINTEPVTSISWTDLQLPEQVAPAGARAAVLLLSNIEPGTQYFTAIRVVPGPVVPAWSAEMQRSEPVGQSPAGFSVTGCKTTASCSTHNTFLRLIVETGIVGFLTMVSYLLTLGWGMLRLGRRSYPWSIAFALVVIAGLTIDTLHWRQLWVYIAVAMTFIKLPARAHAPGSSPVVREPSEVLATGRTPPAPAASTR
jgi:O-antigen ligase